MHHRDYRFRQIAQAQPVFDIALQESLIVVDGEWLRGAFAPAAGKVIAGGKRAPGATNDQNFDLGIPLHLCQRVAKLGDERRCHGIELLRAIQRERTYKVLFFEGEPLCGCTIDADTHVTESPDLWTSRAPASMRDRVPNVVTSDNGTQRWVLAGRTLASVGMTATAGRGSFKHPPKNYDEMHPGAYDANARLKYMDEMGIWAMVMYPNVGGFGAQQFLKLNDPELMLTCVRIYNDWQTEWASADSRRLLPITSIPFWDVDAAVEEIHRCAKKGHKGILFTGEPQYYGKPLLGDPHWKPLWDVSVECDMPISFHIGSGDMQEGLAKARVNTYGKMAAFTELAVDIFLHNGLQLNDLIMSGVLVRHPKIKFVSVESGVGWIPFVLEAMDLSSRATA